MKKVAILTCLEACDVCTGAACFQAWNEKSRGFACYADTGAVLVAFMHCNGCGKDPETDPGMLKKLDRLQSIGVEVVHTGICTVPGYHPGDPLCPTIVKILKMMEARGIRHVRGTH